MYLHRWKIEDNDMCNSCHVIDSLQHYFLDCKLVNFFWKHLKTWFHFNFATKVNFGPLDILLGLPNYGKESSIDVLNYIILFAKLYIQDCKLNQSIDLLP